jgi:hypothetical protein
MPKNCPGSRTGFKSSAFSSAFAVVGGVELVVAALVAGAVDLTVGIADLVVETADFAAVLVDLLVETVDLAAVPVDLLVEAVDLTAVPVDLLVETVGLAGVGSVGLLVFAELPKSQFRYIK